MMRLESKQSHTADNWHVYAGLCAEASGVQSAAYTLLHAGVHFERAHSRFVHGGGCSMQNL